MSDTTQRTRTYPALRLLERVCPPLRHGHPPYWSGPAVLDPAEVLVPTWNWATLHAIPDGTHTVTLTANEGLLEAIGAAVIAHSPLTRMGAFEGLVDGPEPARVLPGYYCITVPDWNFAGTIVHPLGDSARLQTDTTTWVTAPTLNLLFHLAANGMIGRFEVRDSYAARLTTTLRSWCARLRADRERLLDVLEGAHPTLRPRDCSCEACSRYRAFQDGIRAALDAVTIEGGTTHRPNWAHTVRAALAAQQWRAAWAYTWVSPNEYLLAMPTPGEMRVRHTGLAAAMKRTPPPFRMDDTGRTIGAYRVTDEGPLDHPGGAS